MRIIITSISYVYGTYLHGLIPHLAQFHGSTSRWMSEGDKTAVDGSTGGIHKTPTTIGCALRYFSANGDEGFVDSHSGSLL